MTLRCTRQLKGISYMCNTRQSQVQLRVTNHCVLNSSFNILLLVNIFLVIISEINIIRDITAMPQVKESCSHLFTIPIVQ
jgi:hypothetical protein